MKKLLIDLAGGMLCGLIMFSSVILSATGIIKG